ARSNASLPARRVPASRAERTGRALIGALRRAPPAERPFAADAAISGRAASAAPVRPARQREALPRRRERIGCSVRLLELLDEAAQLGAAVRQRRQTLGDRRFVREPFLLQPIGPIGSREETLRRLRDPLALLIEPRDRAGRAGFEVVQMRVALRIVPEGAGA